jgi:hypothetical protein
MLKNHIAIKEMAENIPNPVTERDNCEKISISQLMQKYSVSKAQLYDRMKYLHITVPKLSSKVYLNTQHIEALDGLHEYIQATGQMEGYQIPEPLILVNEHQQQGVLVVAPPEQITTCNESVEAMQRSPQIDDLPSIVKSAQHKAAGTLIAENLLARQFIENPKLLPEELQQKIRESEEVPIIDPFVYAESLINLFQAGGRLSG